MPKRPVLQRILNILVGIAVLAFGIAPVHTFNGFLIFVASLVVFLICILLQHKVDGRGGRRSVCGSKLNGFVVMRQSHAVGFRDEATEK